MSSNFDNFTAEKVLNPAQNLTTEPPSSPSSPAQQSVVEKAEAKHFLREGITAAKSGNRSEAKQLLLEAAHLDAGNETIWLWLASVSEQPAELFEFLQKVLEINAENTRATEWHLQTKNFLVNTEIQRGAALVKENQRGEAGECFRRATEYDSANETAWLWRASVADELEEKLAFLQKILYLNPNNEKAAASFHAVKRQQTRNLLKQGSAAAATGDFVTAREILADVMEQDEQLEEAWLLKAFISETVAEKAQCFNKILEMNPNNAQATLGLESLQFVSESTVSETAETVEEEIVESSEAKTGELVFQEPPPQEAFAEMPVEDSQMQNVESASDFFEQNATLHDQSEHYQLALNSAADCATHDLQLSDEEEVEPQIEFAPETVAENTEFFAESLPAKMNQQEIEDQQFVESAAFDEDFEAEVIENQFLPNDISEEAAPESFTAEVSDENIAESITESEPVCQQPPNDFTQSMPTPTVSHVNENRVEPEFVETSACPFCAVQNPVTAARCSACKAFVSINETGDLMVQDTLDDGTVRDFIERLNSEQTARSLSPEEHLNLGFAYLNLKNFKKGAQHFERAVEIAPSDGNLREKVNQWLIKLHEIAPELLSGAGRTGKTIMVVDDSPTVRKLITGKLEKHGHRVIAAVDGMDALSKIPEVSPDLILLDITMPRLDGYQLCKLIRQNSATKHIPVVMISGKDGFFDKVRGRMAGSTAYITKPFGPETLIQTVETYCR